MPSAPAITAFIPFGIPILSIVVAIPLVLQKVPPNLWYGFRTRKTLSDPDTWYRANYLAGISMLYAGLIALSINLAIYQAASGVLFIILGSLVASLSTAAAMGIAMLRIRDI